ncbi:MAG: hypothetical protein MPN21_05695 [Thermoanaerobaculia bacterium]|nr:hypothetical protein [Thermoanaerobaculia bacterium]
MLPAVDLSTSFRCFWAIDRASPHFIAEGAPRLHGVDTDEARTSPRFLGFHVPSAARTS